MVRGSLAPLAGPERAGAASRHLAGRLTVLRWSTGRRPRPAGPSGQRAAADAGRGRRGRSASDGASLFTGLVLGDDRDQPADLADDFQGAGLTHLLAVSGQNVAFVLALAGPLRPSPAALAPARRAPSR